MAKEIESTPTLEKVDTLSGKFPSEPVSLKVAKASVDKPVKLTGQRWRMIYCSGEWIAGMPVELTSNPKVGVIPVDYEIPADKLSLFSSELPEGEQALQVNTTAPNGELILLRIFPAEPAPKE